MFRQTAPAGKLPSKLGLFARTRHSPASEVWYYNPARKQYYQKIEPDPSSKMVTPGKQISKHSYQMPTYTNKKVERLKSAEEKAVHSSKMER